MGSFSQAQIEVALQAKSAHLTADDMRRISHSRQAVVEMIDEFPESWDKPKRQAMVLFELIEASTQGRTSVHPDDLRFAAGALIYLGAPLDLVPDDEEDGYADDAAVIRLAVERTRPVLYSYCEARGYNPAEYLD